MFQSGLLAGKRILVTGGGTGLGASMGQRFLELGAELVVPCGLERPLGDGSPILARRERFDRGDDVTHWYGSQAAV